MESAIKPSRRATPGPMSAVMGTLTALASLAACSASAGDDPMAQSPLGSSSSAWASDCGSSDQQGDLVSKATSEQMFDAQLTWRQTNDGGQGIGAACNLANHTVTSQGMVDVPLHCTGKSQAQAGYARVGARWGTSLGAPSCTTDYCAVIYIQDGGGGLREAARDIYLKDRFSCSQTSDRTDLRLDVDGCTYADVVSALKQGENSSMGSDQSNLTFVNGHLSGYSGKGLNLKYKMYPCGAGPGGGGTTNNNSNSAGGASSGSSPGGTGCTDVPTPDGYTCAQQQGWGKCSASWMTSGGYCQATCGQCGQAAAPAPSGGSCTDVGTPDGYTCAQQQGWGKCGASWMISGGYCKATCGNC